MASVHVSWNVDTLALGLHQESRTTVRKSPLCIERHRQLTGFQQLKVHYRAIEGIRQQSKTLYHLWRCPFVLSRSVRPYRFKSLAQQRFTSICHALYEFASCSVHFTESAQPSIEG